AVGERRLLRLDVPRVVGAALDPRPPDTNRTRARQPTELGRIVRSVDEVVESVGARHERVLQLVRALHDAVARTNLVHLLVLPHEAGSAEDVVQLFRGAV